MCLLAWARAALARAAICRCRLALAVLLAAVCRCLRALVRRAALHLCRAALARLALAAACRWAAAAARLAPAALRRFRPLTALCPALCLLALGRRAARALVISWFFRVDLKRVLLARSLFLVALLLQRAGMPQCLVARHLVLAWLVAHCRRLPAWVLLEVPHG